MSKDKEKKIARNEVFKDLIIQRLTRELDDMTELHKMAQGRCGVLEKELSDLEARRVESQSNYDKHCDQMKETIDRQAAEIKKLTAMVAASITQPAATDHHQAAIEDAAEKAEA